MTETGVLEQRVDEREQARPRKPKSTCMAKLDRLDWASCNWYEIDEYRFGVRSTSRAFGDWVDHCLAAYRVGGPHEEDDDPMWAVVVDEGGESSAGVGRRFHILYRGTWDVIRTLDVGGVAQALLTELGSIRHPVRDDAVFLEAAVASASGVSILLPHLMVPGLARAVRRVQRAGIVPPGTMVVAVDPATGELVRPEVSLDLPSDVSARFADAFPPNGSDPRIFVDDRLEVDAVLTWGGPEASGLWHAPRADTLMTLASWTRNLRLVGSRGIEGLARLVEGARCYAARWATTNDMIDALVRIGGTGYAIDRSEDTPVGP